MRQSIHTLGFTLAAFARPARGRTCIEAYRLKKLKQLIEHAGRSNAFWRDRFVTHGFEPRDLDRPEDLHRLPVIGKPELRSLRDTVSSEEIAERRLIEHRTSGSTGEPVGILRSPAEERRLNMLRWRLQWTLGLRPGDRVAKVKTTWEPLPARFDRLQNMARAARLLDTRVFDCFREPEENYRRLLAFQPHVLSGYPGALARLAVQHREQGGRMDRLRRVSSGGESLAPHQRRILEEAFGVPVHDVYGATECNLIAWRCPKTGNYHVVDDGVVLEVCRDGTPVAEGEAGEVVITALHSRTMPIIRYAIGDRAVAGPSTCPCGSPFSTIAALEGRVMDFIHLQDGRELHPFELMNEVVLEAADWLLEYQLVQDEPGRVRLLAVPRREPLGDELARLERALGDRLGPATRLEIERIDRIARDAAGKLHVCRSSVQAIP